MTLHLYNTLSKKKELFEPVEPGKVGIYLCGPTVYKESHIGHAVGPVIFDAFKKYLTYKGYDVKLVVNITDVDDKLINEADRQGVSVDILAEKVSTSYFEAMEKLGVNTVDAYPRATGHISQIIELIQRLGQRDAAYTVDGDVYFDISKCKNYGKLSNRRSEDQLEGSRQLAGSGKRNGADFALWKKAGDEELGWDSPWGRGRPGWHIECSVMSMDILGESYDIHGGGADLIFPHHENEIAQSETATGKPFVKYWMHNGLTRIKTKAAAGQWQNEKMSKSLGNIKPLGELLEQYPAQLIRFFLLSTHYRRPIDFSDEAIEAVQKGMMGIYRTLDRIGKLSGQDVYRPNCDLKKLADPPGGEQNTQFAEQITKSQLRYLEAMDDDFNTAAAIAVLFDLSGELNRYVDRARLPSQTNETATDLAVEAARMISSLGQVLGLIEGPIETAGIDDKMVGGLLEILIELRNQARKDKNFAMADDIRDRLIQINIQLEDSPDGRTQWRKG